jgi:hypothetical protein
MTTGKYYLLIQQKYSHPTRDFKGSLEFSVGPFRTSASATDSWTAIYAKREINVACAIVYKESILKQ